MPPASGQPQASRAREVHVWLVDPTTTNKYIIRSNTLKYAHASSLWTALDLESSSSACVAA